MVLIFENYQTVATHQVTYIRYPCKSMAIRDFILSITRWEKWNLHYRLVFFDRMRFFYDTSLQLLANNLTISALHPHSFHLKLRISASRLPTVHFSALDKSSYRYIKLYTHRLRLPSLRVYRLQMRDAHGGMTSDRKWNQQAWEFPLSWS